MHDTEPKTVPIAIIGIGCRFPGDATDPERLWETLEEGRSAWSEIPSSRFNINGWYHPNHENIGTTNVRGGHFLKEDSAFFDANFFGLSAETASTMDPQYRLLLESVYEALENAGITLEQVAGSNTSVFSGAFFHDYQDSLMRDAENLPRFLLSGNGAAIASNRVSHFFDLLGPSMTIDTGCSTTLTALHQACQGLRAGEAEMSIVGGSNLLINPDYFITISSLGMLSPDGKSYSFDSRANGYGRGEGVASIVLKRLDDAVKAGDPIRAVIRETHLNQDGRTETITSPSPQAQESLIRSCFAKAGIDPSSIQYFEAHGTGTPTGDPIEVSAIAKVFKEGRSPKEPLYIGSVKTNLGHTEPTSGLASVIKVVLALERKLIPPSINFETPNNHLSLDTWNLKVPRKSENWPVGKDGVRRCSVNNFGYGGANAHVIMEEWPSSTFLYRTNDRNQNATLNGNGTASPASNLQSKLFVLSAKDELACRAMALNLRDYLLQHRSDPEGENTFLNNLAFTLDQRRSRFPWVSTYASSSVSHLITQLENQKLSPLRADKQPKLGFVFTGQGAQWHAMGRELLHAYPVFKASILEAEMHLREFGCTWSLLEELLRDADESRVNETSFGMPLCAAIQISLVRLLEAWGVTPAAVCSHSSGEIAAAYAVGALSFRSAMAACYCRSEVTAGFQSREGGMVAVGLGASAVEEYLRVLKSGEAKVACINSPSSVTVSGDLPAINELESSLTEQQIFTRRLRVRSAFHSHHMQPLYEPYLKGMREIGMGKDDQNVRSIIYASPTTGTRVANPAELCDPIHWVNSMINPVLFMDAFLKMALSPVNQEPEIDTVIEVGPHAALSGPIGDILSTSVFQLKSISYLPCLVRNVSAIDSMQSLAGQLLCQGFPVNLNRVNFPLGKPDITVISDLPPYPWTHQVRHWFEPRINKSHRDRKSPSHDLLGSLLAGTNTLVPTWRHTIRPSDIPWVREHTVQSKMVYPGAGYVCMAIEAARQMNQTGDRAPSGYRLRNVDILQALLIPEGPGGVEVQLTLGPIIDEAVGLKDWKEFRIFSTTPENKWTEHCKGIIHVDHTDSSEDKAQMKSLSANHKPVNLGGNPKNVNSAEIYAKMSSNHINHGPIFQNLQTISVGKGQAVGTISIADVASMMPENHRHEHIIHPTTLDSIFVAAYGALLGADSHYETPKVPRMIKDMWVSNDIDSQPGHKFESHVKIQHSDPRTSKSSICLVDANGDGELLNRTVLLIDGLVCQSLGATIPSPEAHRDDICSTLQWAPDISLIDSKAMQWELSSLIQPRGENADSDLRRAGFHFVHDALAYLTIIDVQQLEGHHKQFYTWMKIFVNLALSGELAPSSSDWIKDSNEEKMRLFEAVSSYNTSGEVICRLGTRIVPILRQEVDSLGLFMEDRLLHRFYRDAPQFDRCNRQLSSIIKHLLHKIPRLKILEIGAGTGGTTQCLLNAIRDDKGSRSQSLPCEYHFTDRSSTLFSDTQHQLAHWSDIVTYRELDIEVDPATQGFDCGSYDVIVASQVFHATENIGSALAHARGLLKHGGMLLLVESTKDQVDMQFVSGLLPPSWLGRERAQVLGSSSSIPFLDEALRRARFSGVDIDVHDCQDEDSYSLSVIMSTAIEQQVEIRADPVVLVTCGNFESQGAFLESLQGFIATITGASLPKIESINSVDARGKTCIVLELDQPLLIRPSSAEFETVRSLALGCKMLLWVTRGGAVGCENPDFALSSGFLRSLRQENIGKTYISLDLDPSRGALDSQDASMIARIFASAARSSLTNPIREFEFAERGGSVLIPRLIKDHERNKLISHEGKGTPEPSLKPFVAPSRHPDYVLKLDIRTPGILETLSFTQVCHEDTTLESNFIEIEPRAFGLNFRDVMAAMGQLDEIGIGFECCGIVTQVGAAAASHGFFIGCRVIAILGGQCMSRIRIPWTLACPISDSNLSFETAASIPMAFATAYMSLHETAKITKEKSILIHAASGGVGQAAVMLSQLVGAEVFATAGTREKREFMTSKYGIPEDHIFSSRDATFAPKLMAMTRERGVDIVLNSLSGHLLQESFNCLAPFGHFVEIGRFDLEHNNHLQMLPFARVASFSSVNLLALVKLGSPAIHQALAAVARLLDHGAIFPVNPITVYPMADSKKAFRHMQAGKHMGKIVLSIGDKMVPVLLPRPIVKLRNDASYLITGGLGGIGKSVAEWLLHHGAKSLILMSRNAGTAKKTTPFLSELEETYPGAQINAVSCDISNEPEVASALHKCATDLPPIRGVIQAAMVLQDSVLENMSRENYNAAVMPKVQGTWNLHTHVTGDLDFFIMLSSIAGVIGNASQCNYTAGGAFQDALARHRVSKGLPGVSLDIGAVKDVGYVASNKAVYDNLARLGYRLLGQDEVLSAIESAIISPWAQIVVGINTAGGSEGQDTVLARDARFDALRYVPPRGGSASNPDSGISTGSLASRLTSAVSLDQAADLILQLLVKKLVEIFMVPIGDVIASKSMADFGVDSLVAVELRNMLALQAGAEISIFEILQSSSLTTLSLALASRSTYVNAS